MTEGMRVAISTLTLDDIAESWGLENGIDPRSPRWEWGKRLTHIRLNREEAESLKGYLQRRLALYESAPEISQQEPGIVPRYRRDVARLSGV
jgi:hypothetical protein